MNLIEALFACVIAMTYITAGYSWYYTIHADVIRDIQRTHHQEILSTELSRYSSYTTVAGKDPSHIVLNEATTTITTDFIDLDRWVSKVSVTVADERGSNQVSGSKIFTDTTTIGNTPWCGAVAFATTTTLFATNFINEGSPEFTALAPYDRYIIVTSDSSTVNSQDLYVIDTVPTPKVVRALETGPGLVGIVIVGSYAYVANTSTTGQLQVIDLTRPNSPTVVATLKLPLPTSTTTPTRASSIAYANGYVYLGTEKWDGNELFRISVVNPTSPGIVASVEIGSKVQRIIPELQSVFVAASTDPQLIQYAVGPAGFGRLWSFTPSGWQTQEGKSITMLPNQVIFGRTVGGMNVTANHEIFFLRKNGAGYSVATSTDVAAGVYDMYATSARLLFLANGNPSAAKWIRDTTKSLAISNGLSYPDSAKALLCSGHQIIIAFPHMLFFTQPR